LTARRPADCAAAVVAPLGSGRRPAQDARTSRTLLHFGDSLAVGTGVFLPDRLAGWSLTQSFGISRHADEAPAGLRSYGAALPHVIAISLGTNDDPGAASVRHWSEPLSACRP
jgi:hypothetical protein